MKVLVLGGTGFLGQHLMREFGIGKHEGLAVGSRDVDLLDLGEAEAIIRARRWDWVIHAAARVGGIAANQATPGTFFLDNLIMGANVLRATVRAAGPKLCLIGTTCSYALTPPRIPFQEDDLWLGGLPEPTNAGYGLAKRTILFGLGECRREFGLKGISVIPANLYGEGMDSYDPKTSHVIPALIRKIHEAKIAKAEAITLWGTGKASRDFLHVGDCARAIRMLCETYAEDGLEEPVNIGTGVEHRISQVAAMVADIIGWRGRIIWDSSKPDGQPRRALANGRLRDLLTTFEFVTLKDGLKRTYEWYLKNVATSKAARSTPEPPEIQASP